MEDKKWIEKNFPKDKRYETVIVTGENVLSVEFVRHVSLNFQVLLNNEYYLFMYFSS